MIPLFKMEHGAQLRGISLTRASPSALPLAFVLPFNTTFFSMITLLSFLGAAVERRVFTVTAVRFRMPRTCLCVVSFFLGCSTGSPPRYNTPQLADLLLRPRDDLGLL